ncbi:MAG: hypothetical protein WDM71_06305 [Ferruginibacter sp.]
MKEKYYTSYFFDLKKDVNDLKKMFVDIIQNPAMHHNIPIYNNERNDFT